MSSYVYQVTGSFPYIQMAKKYRLDLGTVYLVADFYRCQFRNRFWEPSMLYWHALAFIETKSKLSEIELREFDRELMNNVINWNDRQEGYTNGTD